MSVSPLKRKLADTSLDAPSVASEASSIVSTADRQPHKRRARPSWTPTWLVGLGKRLTGSFMGQSVPDSSQSVQTSREPLNFKVLSEKRSTTNGVNGITQRKTSGRLFSLGSREIAARDAYRSDPPVREDGSSEVEMREVRPASSLGIRRPVVVAARPSGVDVPPRALAPLPQSQQPVPSTSRLPPAPTSSAARSGRRASFESAVKVPESSKTRKERQRREEADRRRLELCAADATKRSMTVTRVGLDFAGNDPAGFAEYRAQLAQFRAAQAEIDPPRIRQRPSERRMQQVLATVKSIEVEEQLSQLRLKEYTEASERQAAIDAELDGVRKRAKRRKFKVRLDSDDESEVTQIFRRQGVISTMKGAEVAAKDIGKLKPGEWLNDEIINFYCVLINKRSVEYSEAYKKRIKALKPGEEPPPREILRTHAFSSFFYDKLKKTGHEGVKRWTKAIDLFAMDVVIVPVNLGNAHWTCAAVNIAERRFEYYDSMSQWDQSVVDNLREYIEAEHLAKKKSPLNMDEWEDWQDDETPLQQNGYDCGMFTCLAAEKLSRADSSWDYGQPNMSYLRRKLALELVRQEILGEDFEDSKAS